MPPRGQKIAGRNSSLPGNNSDAGVDKANVRM